MHQFSEGHTKSTETQYLKHSPKESLIFCYFLLNFSAA